MNTSDSSGASPDELKRAVAQSVVRLVVPDAILGVGTGSTVNHFIEAVARSGIRPPAAVSSSIASTKLLQHHGIPVVELDEAIDSGRPIPLYVDGADEIDPRLALVKGGGGALTREKIIAEAAECFVCIADDSKLVPRLGHFPLPIEVIPMAVALVSKRVRALGAEPRLRAGFVTDNGNRIIDCAGLAIDDPQALESLVEHWPGVVTVGLFARRRADRCFVAGAGGVREITPVP